MISNECLKKVTSFKLINYLFTVYCFEETDYKKEFYIFKDYFSESKFMTDFPS